MVKFLHSSGIFTKMFHHGYGKDKEQLNASVLLMVFLEHNID